MRARDKERVLSELRSRVVDETTRGPAGRLEEVLLDSVYHEKKRLKEDKHREPEEVAFWSRIQDEMRRAGERGQIDFEEVDVEQRRTTTDRRRQPRKYSHMGCKQGIRVRSIRREQS